MLGLLSTARCASLRLSLCSPDPEAWNDADTLNALPPVLGTMFINGIQTQDTNSVLAWLLISATLVIVFNLIADLLYAVLDPRIRLS